MPHGAPYPIKMGKAWKVVVPVRGRLTPKIHRSDFESRQQAADWLRSAEAALEIDAMRERPVLGYSKLVERLEAGAR